MWAAWSLVTHSVTRSPVSSCFNLESFPLRVTRCWEGKFFGESYKAATNSGIHSDIISPNGDRIIP